MLNGQKLQGPQTSAEVYRILKQKRMLEKWVKTDKASSTYVFYLHNSFCIFSVDMIMKVIAKKEDNAIGVL